MEYLKKIYYWIDRQCERLFWFLIKLITAFVLDVSLILLGVYIYVFHISDYGINRKVYTMYEEISAQTGQGQNKLPFYIYEKDIDNAYNDGYKIVMYKGLINNAKSWDEIALVIGHEIAHGNLAHLNRAMPVPEQNPDLGMGDNDHVQILEANADKLGALYMMKAGYNICKGREVFKHWKEKKGNSLGQSHPDYSYRFDELNIGCGDK